MNIKTFISFLITLSICCTISAQQVEFIGVPVKGTIMNFHAKMISKGLTIHPDNKYVGIGNRVYQGRFVGYDAKIIVSYDATSKIVYGTTVFLNKQIDVVDASNQYFSIKKELIAKYGQDNVVATNIDASTVMQGLFSEHKVYLDDGSIIIKLEKDSNAEAYYVSMYCINSYNLMKFTRN